MAQTGYTPIQLYRTATASAAPTSGNLADGELAINTLDGKLFYKDSSGNVQTIATKGAGTIGGSTTQVQFNSSGALGGSASLTWDGTTLTSANSITSPVHKSATTLSLQTNGTTNAVTIDASQNVTAVANLTLSGTAARITGDFSNATFANRVMFQNSVANGRTNISALPNGTSTTTGVDLYGSSSDSANTSLFRIANTNAEYQLEGTRTGTGTYLPMTFYTSGSERMRIDTSGNVGIGTSAPSYRLDVVGSTNPVAMRLYNSTASSGLLFTQDTSNNAGVNNQGTGHLFFGTANTERMRIDSSGNLLVGTTSSSAKLAVVSNITTAILSQASTSDNTSYPIILRNSSGTNLFYVRSDGYILTGTSSLSPYNNTTASAANLTVDSNGGIFRSTSSLKYKRDVQDATHGLAKVMQLRPVTYKGKSETDGETVFGGLIAEEVHGAGLTEFVQYAENGTPDALAYGNMVALAFKAIQELSAKVTALESK